MKEVVSKLNRSIWLLTLLAVFGLLLPTVASAFSTPRNLFAYDEQTQASIAYDGNSLTAFDYDFASTLSANESANRIRDEGGVFAQFAKFLAAKGGGNVLLDSSVIPGLRQSPDLGGRILPGENPLVEGVGP
jgi:hypothetical protein